MMQNIRILYLQALPTLSLISVRDLLLLLSRMWKPQKRQRQYRYGRNLMDSAASSAGGPHYPKHCIAPEQALDDVDYLQQPIP